MAICNVRVKKEQNRNTELRLQVEAVEKERDFFQEECSRDRQQTHKSKHEATAELCHLQEQLSAAERTKASLEKAHEEELKVPTITITKLHLIKFE